MKIEYECKKNASIFKVKTCILIVIILIMVRLISNFEFNTKNYVAAFETLGEGLNGQKAFSDAVKDAYIYAFSDNEESLIYAAGINDEEKIER